MTILESNASPLRMGISQLASTSSPSGGGLPSGGAAWMGVYQEQIGVGTGDKSFTVSGMGTPKAALIMFASDSRDSLCVGAVTATDERWYVNHHSVSAVGTMDCETTINDNGVLRGKDGAAVEHVADFVEFIEDGMTLNFATNNNDLAFMNIIFFGGSDCVAKAVTHTVDGNAVDNTVDVNTVGFEPELVFSIMGNSDNTSLGTDGVGLNYNLGITHNDGGADPQPQYGFTWSVEDGTGSVSLRSQHRNNSQYAIVSEDDGGANLVAAELLGFDSSGFTVHTRERTNWGTTFAGALCISWGGTASLHLTAIDTATANGTVSYTGPGFEPENLVAFCSRSGDTATETVGTTDGLANGVGFGIVESTFVENWSMHRYDDDNSQTANPNAIAGGGPSMTHDRFLSMSNIILAENDILVIDIDSFDATGYTLDYVNAASTAKSLVVLAFLGAE